MSEIHERLSNYLSSNNITQRHIAECLGISEQSVNALVNGRRAFGRKTSASWQKHFGLSASWLMTGEGEMLASKDQPEEPAKAACAYTGKEPCIVPLLPISAQGGTFNDFTLSVRQCDCEKLISPIYGVDFAISVSGDSMEPEYPSGAQVLIKKVNERAFLEWGKVYVLDTCNGTVIKRLMPTEQPDRVRCESINPKYPPFEVSLEHVFGVYRVMMCLSMK